MCNVLIIGSAVPLDEVPVPDLLQVGVPPGNDGSEARKHLDHPWLYDVATAAEGCACGLALHPEGPQLGPDRSASEIRESTEIDAEIYRHRDALFQFLVDALDVAGELTLLTTHYGNENRLEVPTGSRTVIRTLAQMHREPLGGDPPGESCLIRVVAA